MLALPSRPPTITVVSQRQSSDGCGEAMILNCSANQVERLFTPPTITWISPDGSEVHAIGEGSNPAVNPQTKELIFSDSIASNTGTYTCRAVVNIPEAQIVNYFDEATVEINTACKLTSVTSE